jgi:acetolactate synthase-1/2/3 large subunit
LKGSDLFVKCLENEGVQYIFGLPGEEMEDILFSLERSSIKFIPTRHEQGAAFMADMWGRLSGQAGVCLSTLGPGATNLVTGVADANLDKSPLVAISAQADIKKLHKESHQYLDLVDLFRPVTKWNGTIANGQVIPEVVRKAFKMAESEKPGATHIEFSEEVAASETQGEPILSKRVRRPDPDESALEEAVALLKRSRFPMIIAGNGAVRKMASEQLTELVKKHNIPVAHTFMGQGAVLDAQAQSLFSIGFGFRDIVMDAVDQADLIIAVGYDIAEYAPDAWNPGKDKKIIHIDFTFAEVYTHYQPNVEIVADIPATLKALNQKLDSHGISFDRNWYRPIREHILEDRATYALKEGQPFTTPGVLNILQSIMHGDDLLISDVGSHKVWIARNFSACCPNGCIISNGLASMGFALPGAVAAGLHSPGRRIVAAMGDGGFLMNSQELETAKRLGLGFTVIIFNDNDYGLISWKQEMSRGKSTGTKINNPDFKAYAESFGIKAYRPANANELCAQLTRALDLRELSVFEIPIDVSVNQELIKKLNSPRKVGSYAKHRPDDR